MDINEILAQLQQQIQSQGLKWNSKNLGPLLNRILALHGFGAADSSIGFNNTLEQARQRNILSQLGGGQSMLEQIRNNNQGNAVAQANAARAAGVPFDPTDYNNQSLIDTNAQSRAWSAGQPMNNLNLIGMGMNDPAVSNYLSLITGTGIQDTPKGPTFGQQLLGAAGTAAGLGWNPFQKTQKAA